MCAGDVHRVHIPERSRSAAGSSGSDQDLRDVWDGFIWRTRHQGLSSFSPAERAFVKFVQRHSDPYAPSPTRHKVNCMASSRPAAREQLLCEQRSNQKSLLPCIRSCIPIVFYSRDVSPKARLRGKQDLFISSQNWCFSEPRREILHLQVSVSGEFII